MAPRFVHLHVHSEYSLADGIVRIKPLVNAALACGMPAVALTDQSNLFAMVRFYKAALAAGVKPIVGSDVWIRNPDDANKPFRLVLLVQDLVGYRNLTELLSRAYREGQHLGTPQMEREWLEGSSAGLIALSGGRDSDVGRALLAGDRESAESRLAVWHRLFGDRYYLELVRTGRTEEGEYLEACVALAAGHDVPVVATNDVRFLRREDFEAHEVRVCIHDGRTLDDSRRPRLYSEEQYFRTQDEMLALFADIPEALENSLEIAKRCNLELTLGRSFLPDFPVPEGRTLDEWFREQSKRGLEARLIGQAPGPEAEESDWRRVYDERLESELDVIIKMGFAGYFLIVADFIAWARDHGIPVGPGRGSGAGSLAAYSLRITDLDPIAHDLLFERFLNPERVSMPDFDIDFCMENRDRVIEYVAERYGRDAVSQIITFGTMAAKAVVRDVGRVLGQPYGFVDKIAKLVPFDLKMTLDRALKESEDLRQLYDSNEEVHEIIDMARKLEGLARNAGKHAGGVVIAPGKLTEFAPLYCEPGGEGLVTQFDKDDVEGVGLVKFDFLGLRTLTIVDWALDAVNKARGAAGAEPVDISRIPMDDPEAFALLKRCETTAVFQLESRGMKDLIKKLQPDSFDDITALVALFRPGPLQSGMVDDFINRKHGRAEVAYPHPKLEPILKSTYGVILYQEQVMQIAQALAGYTLGGADLLRRAMGKKKPEEMAKQREVFLSGAVARGVDQQTASFIFDLMEKFAGYGFNKSHSAAYALVAYQTLWLKSHYPAAFMAAVLSADMDNTDKVVTLIEECRRMRLRIRPPDINGSSFRFSVEDGQTVVYGLGAIKGVGHSAIESIVAARESGGAFADLWDFCRRVDLHRVNRRVLEALIRAGALDGLGANRATLMLQLPLALKLAEQHKAVQAAGQDDLFGMNEPAPNPQPDPQQGGWQTEEWDDDLRLRGEKETLGLYLTGHPIERYEPELRHIVASRIAPLLEGEGGGGQCTLAGLVVGVRHSVSQRGRMGSIILDDRTGRIEVTLFSEQYERWRDLLTVDRVLVATGNLVFDDFRNSWSLRADRVQPLAEARETFASHLLLRLRAQGGTPDALLLPLKQALSAFQGGPLPVHIELRLPAAEGLLRLGESWNVHPTDELLRRLRTLLGADAVAVVYAAKGAGKRPALAAVR